MPKDTRLRIASGCLALFVTLPVVLWRPQSLGQSRLVEPSQQGVTDPVAARADLSSAQKKWRSKKLQSYEYTFQMECVCPSEFLRPVTFRIERGKPSSVPTIPSFAEHNTIDKVLAYLWSVLEEARPARFVAEYDQRFGFPSRVSIDFRSETVDDELSLTISNFKDR